METQTTQQPHSPGTGTYTLVTEPDQGLSPIYNLIAAAVKSIDITIYELSDTKVTAQLVQLAASGVAVRVILDQNNEKANNTAAYTYLTANKVNVHWANHAYLCTHQKTITVDQTTSAIMTLNLTPQDYTTTRDFAVITTNAADVAAIVATFEADFTDATITPSTGDNLVWSPTNSRNSLLALIDGATKSLLISQEEIADTGLETALASALKRDVALTMVQENVGGKYSPVLNTLKSAGAQISIYSSRTGHYIHAKTVLADYGTPQAKLFVGSENFSTYSLDKNRELGLILSDAGCMDGVHTAITTDFNNGTKY
jgi:phosphatidylserine/phosphatidylglycerophosphate/cardiolipin synthase-like enzyme